MLVCASFDAHCTRDRGCSAHPVFPAPSVFEGDVFSITSGASRRENANVCQVPVIARSEATKQSILCAARWIASRSLSSGAHSRDPLARNDGEGAVLVLQAPTRWLAMTTIPSQP